MRKMTIVIAVLAAAALPLAAQAKSKKAAPAKAPEPISQNEASWRLAKGAVPLFLPVYVLPVYLKLNGDLDKPAAQDTKKK